MHSWDFPDENDPKHDSIRIIFQLYVIEHLFRNDSNNLQLKVIRENFLIHFRPFNFTNHSHEELHTPKCTILIFIRKKPGNAKLARFSSISLALVDERYKHG